MNSVEISRKIQEQEQREANIKAELDSLYRDAQALMPAAAAAWIDTEVQEKVSELPEVIQSLGTDKIKELKNKINLLKLGLEDEVKTALADQSLWPHNNVVAPVNRHNQSSEWHLDGIFRDIISNLGAVLEPYGLLGEQRSQSPTWKNVGNGRFRFSINTGLHLNPDSKIYGEIHRKSVRYNELLSTYRALQKLTDETRSSLSKAKASELWEQA